MNRYTKVLLILLFIGIGGAAIVFGYIVGSGQLMPRDATQDYAVKESFHELNLDTAGAHIDLIPSEQTHITAFAKAWLPEPVNMDDVVKVKVQDGALNITETPFPSTFLGVFPQPYELRLTLHLPPDICEAYREESDQ